MSQVMSMLHFATNIGPFHYIGLGGARVLVGSVREVGLMEMMSDHVERVELN